MTAQEWCARYRALGWKVLPLMSPEDKHPKQAGWQKLPSLEPEEVEKHHIPALCIQTGPVSGLLALDCDSAEAVARLRRELLEAGIEEWQVPVQKTKRGAHFLFAWPEDWPDQRGVHHGVLFEKCDVRGWHAQINACPAVNKLWVQGPWSPPQLPDSFKARLEKKTDAPSRDPNDLRTPGAALHAIAAALARFPAKSPDEHDGSSLLMKRTAHAVRGFHVYDEDDFIEAIALWNAKRKDTAFSEDELRAAHVDVMATFRAERGGQVFAPLELADTAHAGERFAWHMQQEGQYVSDIGAVWEYNDGLGIWSEIGAGELSRRLLKRMQAYPTHGRSKELMLEPARIRGIADITFNELAVPSFFDVAPVGVGVLNGFVELVGDRAVLRERRPENRARFVLPFEFRHGLVDELWLDFLDGLFKGTDDAADRIALLQQFAGAMLFGLGPRFAKALLLLGEGSNGKSLWLDAVTALLPPSALTSVPPQAWEHEYARFELRSALVNAVGELPARALLDGSSFKSVVEGGLINARQPRERVITFRPKATHVFSANALPSVTDLTHGFWRRFIVLSFPNRFEKNVEYERAVRGRPSAVLSWAVAGAESLLAAGAFVGADLASKREWQHENDTIAQYLEECTRALGDDARGQWSRSQSLYDLYVTWAKRRGMAHPYAMNGFAKQLARLGVQRIALEGYTRWALSPVLAAI